MANRSIVVELQARVAGYLAGMKQAGAATADLATRVEKSQAALDGISSKSTVAGAALVAGLVLSGKAAIEWESAWAGVTKTVDGSTEQLGVLEGQLREMARTMPATHTEIAAVAEAAGQLGVKTEDVAGFTRVMIDLGETTNLTADQAATSLAQFMNVMGTSADDVSRLGSAVVDLGNKGASTERDIVEMAQRIAAAGKSVGMAETDVLGFASALASVGVEAEAGGTAISQTFRQIDAATRAGGKSLELIAKTAGVSAEEYRRAWGEDAAGATQMFVEGLGRVAASGGDANAILSELGMTGIRQSDSLLRLAQAGSLLGDNLDTAGTAWSANSALAEEAGKRYATTESKIRIAWNNIKDAGIEAGGALLPMVADLADGVSKLAQGFAAIPAPVRAAGTGLIAISAGALLAVGGVTKLLSVGLNLRADMRELASVSPKAAAGLSTLGKMAGVAGVALAAGAVAASAIQSAIKAAAPTVADLATEMMRLADSGGDMGSLETAFAGLEVKAGNLSEALAYMAQRRGESASGWAQFEDGVNSTAAAMFGMQSSTDMMIDRFGLIDQALTSLPADEAADMFTRIAAEAEAAGVPMSVLAELLPSYAGKLQEAQTAAGGYTTSAQALTDAVSGAAEATRDHTQSMADQANLMLQLSGTAMGLEAAIDEGMSAAKKATEDFTAAQLRAGDALDISTEKGRANRGALDGIASAAISLREAQKQAGASTADLDAKTVAARAAFIGTARQMGMNQREAEQLADKYGLIPEGVITEVSAPGATVSKQQAKDLNAQLRGLPAETRARIKTIADTSGATAAQAAINRVKGKTVTINVITKYTTSGNKSSTGRYQAQVADGGMFDNAGRFGLMQTFADGGQWDGSFATAQPQIRAAGGRGVRWAEDGAGPWEGFVSGHPAKKRRSRTVAADIVERLGGQVVWHYRDGGFYSPGQTRGDSSFVSRDNSAVADALAALGGAELKITGFDPVMDRAYGRLVLSMDRGI